jgi:dienelactone hydrolase
MSEQRDLTQAYGDQTLTHVIVHDETGRVLPTVIIIPTVMGVQLLEIGFAERLNALGYHAVVADLSAAASRRWSTATRHLRR